MSRAPTLEVGYVARAHGIHGELAVRTFDPESEVLTSVRRLVLRSRSGAEHPARIEEGRRTTGAFLLTLTGIAGRSEAAPFWCTGRICHRWRRASGSRETWSAWRCSPPTELGSAE